MFSQLLTWIEGLSVLVPLELFVLIGSIIEELFSPIPSPLITTTAGFLVASGEGR